MKKMNHSIMGLVLTSITLLSGNVYADGPDPVLTENSQKTFDVDFDGLPLSLPVELKSLVMATADGNRVTNLQIGNVDIAYNRNDIKTSENKLVKGWIEVQAFKSKCIDQEELENIKKLLLSQEQDTIKVQHIVNEKFKGYLVNWAHTTRGKLSRLALNLIDSQKSVCYTFSLAIQDFDAFRDREIKDAVSPLTNAIKKSMDAYTH